MKSVRAIIIVTICLLHLLAFPNATQACKKEIKIESLVNLNGETMILPKNSRLIFQKGGKITNGEIVGRNTSIVVEGDSPVFDHNVTIDGTWNNDLVNMSWFACYHDGIHDDMPVFRKVVKMISSNAGGEIILEKNACYYLQYADDPSGGHTLLPVKDAIGMDFRHLNKVSVNMNGSTIKMSPSHSTKYAFFLFLDCKYFEIYNGTIVGDAKCHDYSDIEYLGKKEASTHEWGTGIIAYGSRGYLHDLCIKEMTGDGVLVGSVNYDGLAYHADTRISNVDISYCRRCGVGCSSSRGLLIEDSYIHHIGSWGGIIGTSPQDGINLEYEDLVYDIGDITISGCIIDFCSKKTISASNTTPPRPRNLLIENCSLNGSVVQVANVEQKGVKRILNCRFQNAPINLGNSVVEGCSFTWKSGVNYIQSTQFNNCSFEGKLDNLIKPYGLCFASTSPSLATFRNCSFTNIRGLNNKSASVQGFSGYAFPIVAEFYKCVFNNCSFVQGTNCPETKYSFYNSELINGCTIYNEAGNAMKFVNSVLDNVSSYKTQDGKFKMTRCKLIQTDKRVENPLVLYGTHILKDCNVIDEVGITQKDRVMGISKHKIMVSEVKK